MNAWFPHVPGSPEWRVDWSGIVESFPWLTELAGCPQDPRHHAEGDVLVHTRLACEALAATPAFRSLPAAERMLLFAAVLLHDIAKPGCTRTETDGSITSPHHGPRGAIRARTLLWEMHAPFSAREQVAALIRFHQVPFHLLEYPESRRRAIEVSQSARCDLLALLAEADARGRVCHDQAEILENVALFTEYCREVGCFTAPYTFPSDHARFQYFRTPGRDPDYNAFDDTRCEVVLMSGLPGSGKDHWLRGNLPEWPVISLDALREEMGIAATEPQAAVASRARDAAREFLRQGRDFAWNATNLSREMRERSLSLLAAYRARVRIVYVEVPRGVLREQNTRRVAPVPEPVIARLLRRWEVPDGTEAHRVDWYVRKLSINDRGQSAGAELWRLE